MTDHLDPRAETWKRPVRPPESITEAPIYWRRIAARETNARRADEYRALADMLDHYLALRGGVPCGS